MITIRDLKHEFVIGKKNKKQVIPVLNSVNLHIEEGEIVTILGRSGSGKSTLLNLISGYMKPTAGTIHILNQDVTNLSEGEWADFRLQHIGFIFQSFQLIPSMTAFQNVELPLKMKGMEKTKRLAKVEETLEKVGLAEFAGFYPSELSGGQQQRVGIARALVGEPKIILADEPTGSLDVETENEFLTLIHQLNQNEGITFLVITHDREVAKIGHRSVTIANGTISESGGEKRAIQR
ncbi:acetoin utilization transport system ATP-binding protein [Bacillus oleivorans]|uniref:Acetoin utilization transport system ATP-binding protein n=1 Tax=Bacillus oleivorans TaxID=1448271 RepID=A0A285CJ82_9BACI|nr:ABC transporter ATP-binding protein [Bacillus oleivorans]SNX67043.1 acetoin utilization transport system ATP-binding protein [Bacillus oleivorans]